MNFLHRISRLFGRRNLSVNLQCRTDAQGFYRTRIRNPDGTRTTFSPWAKNLILDCGLDNRVNYSLGNGATSLIQHAGIGTGTRANTKDSTSSSVTLNQSGTDVTTVAGASFFVSTDTGNILKWGTGSGGAEVYIMTYVDATHVTVSAAGSHAGERGIIHYVSQTALQTWHAADNGLYEADITTYSVSGIPTVSFKKGFQFPAEGGPVTIKEVSIGADAGNTNLWSRFVISGAGDALLTGQIYELEYLLVMQLPDGAAQVAVGDTSGGTWDTAGTAILDVFDNWGVLDPTNYYGSPAHLALITSDWPQRTIIASGAYLYTGGGGSLVSGVLNDSHSAGGYSPGTFTRTTTHVFNIGSANTTIYGLAYTGRSDAYWTVGEGWSLHFTTPVAKDSSHTLTFTMTLSWGRILTN